MIGRMNPVPVTVYRADENGDMWGFWEMVSASPTDTKGLVITPELTPDGESFTGMFQLTHVRSGMSVGPPHEDPEQLRKKAAELGAIEGVAWDRQEPFALSGEEGRLRASLTVGRRRLQPGGLLEEATCRQ